eukprot:CAMPEP_0174835610 /NCGR_PEP_ID=MMETSP1114-20130205/5498_1 /TAXON_ID=312471 /ORGANISM="Neobodo designis, Strain CCAP 1951/1" /LENGTH=247 /DNA_ID=CAMNT_0016069563 /DNA_START=39 /DNA_END=782 /DNA_ORIENTATION=+
MAEPTSGRPQAPPEPKPPAHGTVQRNRAPVEEAARSSTATASFGRNAGDLPPRRPEATGEIPANKRAANFAAGWYKRQKARIVNNKFGAAACLGGVVLLTATYERYSTFNDLTPSPNVVNPQLYRVDAPQAGAYLTPVKDKLAEWYVGYLPRWLQIDQWKSKADIDVAKEMEALREAQAKDAETPRGRMHVQATEMDHRSGFWDVRSHERNWSRMTRDIQRQKDDVGYRLERSRDNDYDRRNTSLVK